MIKVLVVDDERDVEFLFDMQFRKEIRAGKLKIHYAFSGQEALDFMKTVDPFDIVLLMSDINMPGMTGIELLQRTRENYPSLKVVMITAYNDDRNRDAANQYGAHAFLTKPVNFTELRELIFNLKNQH